MFVARIYKKTDKFDTDNLRLQEVKLNPGKKGETGYIRYEEDGSENVVNIQSNKYLRKPFSLSKYLKDGLNESDPNCYKYSMMLSLQGDDGIVKCIKDMDDWALNLGVENSKKWFQKKLKKDQLSEFYYNKSLKEPKNKDGESMLDKFGYQMTVKIPTKSTGEFNVAVYNHKKEKIPNDEIEEALSKKNLRMKAMIEVTALWIAGKKQFGLTYRVTQIRLEKPSASEAYAFEDSSDDEEDVDDVDDVENTTTEKNDEGEADEEVHEAELSEDFSD